MARYDVDGVATTYHPSSIAWQQPEVVERHDGSWTRSTFWFAELTFYGGQEVAAAAFEEWEEFADGEPHSIVLPPPNDVSGGDSTYSNVFIRVITWPEFVFNLARGFAVRVGPVSFT